MATTGAILYHDREALAQAINPEEHPQASAALEKYADILKETLVQLCGLKEFSHVAFLEQTTSYQGGETPSPLAIVVGPAAVDEDGSITGVTQDAHVLDILGALTASNQLPPLFTDKVGMDEEGVLGFADDAMAKVAEKFNSKLGLDSKYTDVVTEEEDEAVAEALSELVPETELVPLHPEDVLGLLPAFLHAAAGPVPRAARGTSGAGGGGPLSAVKSVVGTAFGFVRDVGAHTRTLRKAVWRVEDVAIGAAKLGLRLARKAVRPVLVGVVLHRALRTIEESHTLEVRLAKMNEADALDAYMRHMLGDDYGQQMQADLLAAVKEVNDGYITDDYKEEKRKLTAAMIRRLEVEEWDKERMKHFYYGSYGLGPWYFDMEERLHNPYFIGGRAWNGPIEGWVGKNKVYHRDLPAEATDWTAAAIKLVEEDKGVELTPAQKARIIAREQVRPLDDLTKRGGLLDGVLPKETFAAAASS